jgi:hypothetical protein
MARLYYMSLPGVGPWDAAMKEVGAQLRPYRDYLTTAIKAAERRKPVLGWREAREKERRDFNRRLEERYQERQERAARSQRRRDRRVRAAPEGVWIVLLPPPWRQEEPDDTFDAFLGAKNLYEDAGCSNRGELTKLEFDREGRALLVKRLPELVVPKSEDVDSEPTAAAPHGPLLWLRPDTYTLARQRHALQDLENAPGPRLAPLVRLASTQPRWDDIEPACVEEDDWVFLRRQGASGVLRDGTEEQRRFVSIALGTPDFAILEGPPGSGKTTAICELIVQLARVGKRVLLVASTHVAVDNVLERLLAWQDRGGEKVVLPVRIGDEDRVTIDEVKPWIYNRLRQTWRDELLDFLESPDAVEAGGQAARRILREALEHKGSAEESPLTRLLLESANLVCGTTIGILQHPAIKASRKGTGVFEPFDVMILDEASKTTFTEFLVPALHARRWIIVGDVKQLSPYVEEVDLAENVRGLVPDANARAAAHAFLAARRDERRPLLRSVLATDEVTAGLAGEEARAREVAFIDLDDCAPVTLRGVDSAVPELLYADLVVGSPQTLSRFAHRLPPDLLGSGGPMPSLSDWEAARSAFVRRERQRRYVEIQEDSIDWAGEIAWRLVRSYELRQNDTERERYLQDIKDLLPVTLGDWWFTWRGMKARSSNGGLESSSEALRREIKTIRRVAMPSILELLQTGFERLPGWKEQVALTDGLPRRALARRLVSLSYQHRMHPDISAFSREQFYTPEDATEEPVLESLLLYGLLRPTPRSSGLLKDAQDMVEDRDWSYSRYARRALWLEVSPGRRGRGNVNAVEAEKVVDELQAFVAWADANPNRDRDGRPRPWEAAVLTFYRGQETELRERLKRLSGQWGNSRNFRLPMSTRSVRVTLCTVDRFQGHEADIVFLSFVKSGSVGFLNSPNRLNVALTRARYQIVLIGHRAYFAGCKSALLKELATSNHYRGDITWEVTQ